MSSQEDRELLDKLYSYHLALVSNSGLTQDSFKSTQKSARDNFEELTASMRPWAGRNAQERLGQEKEQLAADWKYYFGWDMTDKKKVAEYAEKRNEAAKEYAEAGTRKVSERFEGAAKMLDTRERVRQRRARAYRNSRK
tara:strand:+ start:449 stop:865 length:417 start_codon:yes stop_codon:yes gene_type:complete